MDADIQGCINQINKSYRAFIHRNNPMSKEQVKAVLEYGLQKGYKSTSELSDKEVDEIIFSVKSVKTANNNQITLF